MLKKIKLPDSDGLEAAAADFGAQRSAVLASAPPPVAPAAPVKGPEVAEEQKKLETEEDEEELC